MASEEKKAKTWTRLLFSSGRFAIGIMFSAGFLLLVWELSQAMEKMDWSKVDPTQVALVVATGAISIASSVASYYFASQITRKDND